MCASDRCPVAGRGCRARQADFGWTLATALMVAACGSRTSIDDLLNQGDVPADGGTGGGNTALGGNPPSSGGAPGMGGDRWGWLGGAPGGGMVLVGGATPLGGAVSMGGGTIALGGAATLGGAVAVGGGIALGGVPVGGTTSSGGTTGGTNSGGTGTGGEGDCGPLIDDMESNTGFICHGSGRVGAWYACNDGTGTQIPEPTEPGTPILPYRLAESRGSSQLAMYTQGGGFDDWGAGIGVDLAFDGETYGLYNGLAYGGIRFWARSDLWNDIDVRISTAATTLTDFGGRCEEEPCNPPQVRISLTPEWQQFALSYLDFSAPRDGFDEIVNIQFFPRRYEDFDYWIDDLAFLTDRPDCCPPLDRCRGRLRYQDPALVDQLPSEAFDCSSTCYVEELTLEGRELESLDGLECLGALESLTLRDTSVTELGPLHESEALESLSIDGQDLETFEPLVALPHLARLSVDGTEVEDWSSLSQLSSLTHLYLVDVATSDLVLVGLPHLEQVQLFRSTFERIELADSPQLELLYLDGARMGSLGLAALDALTTLDLRNCSLPELQLNDLPGLVAVDIYDGFMDGATLSALPSLRTLSFGECGLDRLRIGDTPALQTLSIAGNRLEDLPSLDRLPPLDFLSLRNNELTAVDVANFPPCARLDLSQNRLTALKVTDLDALEQLIVDDNDLSALILDNLPALTQLQASNNPLAELAIHGTPDLTTLRARSCALERIEGLEELAELQTLDVPDNRIADVRPLVNLPVLRQISLKGNQLTSLALFVDFVGLRGEPANSRFLDVSNNPFECAAEAGSLDTLAEWGVTVFSDCE